MNANKFEGMAASVFPSQTAEIVLSKQPVLAEHQREVRSAISQLPPEVSRDLLAKYGLPSQNMVGQVEAAIMSRELAIENVEQGVNLDKQWLNSSAGRRIDENGLSAEDDWNSPGI